MSSRQLRKLQQQRELEHAKLQAEAQDALEEESEEEAVLSKPSKQSLFANLAALENEGDIQEDEDEEESAGDDLSKHDPAPTIPARKSKKQKKKKRKAAKAKEDPADQDGNTDGTDDIDAALKELNLNLKPNPDGASTEHTTTKVDPEYQRVCALLGINSQHLKLINEMRNLFGKDVTDTHADDPQPVGRRGRRGQNQAQDLESVLKGQHPKGKGLPALTLRRNTFIQGKDDWPKASTGGLSMEIVDDKAGDGTVEFKYVYDQEYTAVQGDFLLAVHSMDSDNMIRLLQKHPYNVSLLLIVSKLAKRQGDHALAADLLERALFTFGRAATTLFNSKMTQGKARLDFARPENRELWLAGYHYIKALMMKSTYRTALEWAKFLLALDPEGDPYCMHLVIHNLAVRSHEFQYILDVYDSRLPELWSEFGGSSLNHTLPSLAYAAMQLKESTRCREFLSKSMESTPWLFNRLFQEINLDSPPSIWGITPRSDAETLFTEIYVLQTKDLWNTPAATALLMEIAHTISKVDEKTIPRLNNSTMTLDVVRYVYVDDNPAIMKFAPKHLLHQENNSDYDPLPPLASIYSPYSVQNFVARENPQRGFGLGDDLNNPLGGLMAFIQDNRQQLIDRGIDPEHFRRMFVEDASDSDGDEPQVRQRGADDESVDSDDDGAHQQPDSERGIIRRVLDMFWGGGVPTNRGSDDEVPSLAGENGIVARTGEEHGETDEEMPELIDDEN